MWWYLTPIVVLGVIVVLFALIVVLGRFRGGALLRPVIARLSKIGFIRRFFTKISTAALERQNPELASAIKKITPAGTNPQAMQKAMSRLTPAERRAYIEATAEQAEATESLGRQQRRQFERAQRQASGRPGGGGSKRKRRR